MVGETKSRLMYNGMQAHVSRACLLSLDVIGLLVEVLSHGKELRLLKNAFFHPQLLMLSCRVLFKEETISSKTLNLSPPSDT